MVELLGPLTANPNDPNNSGTTPIYHAAFFGHTKIVQILSKLTDNPNAPSNSGWTPIHWVAAHGHTEIVKIPLTDNPNAPDNKGITPSSVTKNDEIRKMLESFNTTGNFKA